MKKWPRECQYLRLLPGATYFVVFAQSPASTTPPIEISSSRLTKLTRRTTDRKSEFWKTQRMTGMETSQRAEPWQVRRFGGQQHTWTKGKWRRRLSSEWPCSPYRRGKGGPLSLFGSRAQVTERTGMAGIFWKLWELPLPHRRWAQRVPQEDRAAEKK